MLESKKEVQDKESITRRKLLKAAGCAGAAALLIGGLKGKADAALSGEKTYPQVKIANVSKLKVGKPVTFDYPLVGRKSILMDMGCQVEEGAGSNKSIVAYSIFCTHLGCSVDLDKESGMLMCECHQTLYDPKQSGKVIEGPAPNSLPMIVSVWSHYPKRESTPNLITSEKTDAKLGVWDKPVPVNVVKV